jgi:hypothetical protein
LVVFDVLEGGELVGPLAHVPTGRHPRNFNIDPSGRWLLVGNAHDDNVAVYSISPETGVPEATGSTLEVPTPTRILFAPPQRLSTTAGTIGGGGGGGASSAATVVSGGGGGGGGGGGMLRKIGLPVVLIAALAWLWRFYQRSKKALPAAAAAAVTRR